MKILILALAICCSAIRGSPLSTSNATDDDSWRAQALLDIEKYRKSDLHVTVTDPSGMALSDVKVHLEMTQQGFLFGTAVGARQLMVDVNTAARFQQFIQQNFNSIVFENDHKWPQWLESKSNTHNTYRMQWTNDAMNWAQQRNIRIRGHAMLWGSWRWSPNNIPRDPTGLRNAIATHQNDIGPALRGRLAEWDVLNEPYSENDFTNVLGRNEMLTWFRQARQVDPSAKLYLNDYPHPGDQNFINFDADCLRLLVQGGAPVQGFGIQGHVGNSPWNIQQYQNMMNTFANTGVDLAVTEYDTEISNEQTDANALRDMLLATFAHPRQKAFLVWGFWDPIHWKGRAMFLRQDWSEKPALNVWRDLTRNQWWSNVEGTTDEEGHYSARVFQGEYNIHVTRGNETKIVKATVNQEQQVQSLNIVF